MLHVVIGPRQVEDRIGEFATLFSIKFPYFHKDLGDDVMVEASLARRWEAMFFHCNQREELVIEPSFSAKPAQGRR